MYYPIVNNVTKVDSFIVDPDHDASNTVVAMMVVEIYWRDLIRNILPKGSDGIVVVVECICNANFTYQVFGSEVKYLGVGDLHDIKYDHLKRSGKPADFTTSSIHKKEYSGHPLAHDFCPYTFHIYPSDLMNSDFQTNNAVIFMVSMIGIFAFISVVFYLYDRKVERRQKRIAITAQRSSAMISSLFPSTVRDQLYETQAEREIVARPRWGLPFTQNSSTGEQVKKRTNSSPIAQLYQDTTVIFMNLVGFKQWSANRPPTQIFQLLETIYAKFDELAKAHRVFKVETIGDSYVAVVGLPSTRKRHAVVMERFANDCRESIRGLLKQLEESLGQVRYIKGCLNVSSQ
jgi:hypothetical protein